MHRSSLETHRIEHKVELTHDDVRLFIINGARDEDASIPMVSSDMVLTFLQDKTRKFKAELTWTDNLRT